MKVLIWILCFFTNGLITTLIRSSGIILGGIPTALMFTVTLWLARSLCNKWDKYKDSKSNQKSTDLEESSITEENIEIHNTDQVCFCRKCGEKLIDNSRFCRKCGTEVIIL